MNTKSMKMLGLLIILVNAAAVIGWTLAQKPRTPDTVAPYIDNGFVPKGHEWARDQAVSYLGLSQPDEWSFQDVTPTETLGTAVYRYNGDGLTATVSHCLNPTADYQVTVEYQSQTWSMWVSQNGECSIIK
jgi:hypothetical protein